jgi:aspartyl/asparaginyl beta-hydroxylase (cupin superfamily)
MAHFRVESSYRSGLHWRRRLFCVFLSACACSLQVADGFQRITNQHRIQTNRLIISLDASKGFGIGSNGGTSSSSSSEGGKKQNKTKNRLKDILDDTPKPANDVAIVTAKPFVKAEQDQLIEQMALKAGGTAIGRAVAESFTSTAIKDPFWELMPSIISSKFPAVRDDQLQRIAGFVRHTLALSSSMGGAPIRPADWIDDPHRPYAELHAYMPHLGPTQPFYDPSTLALCKRLQDKYETICQEYQALLDHGKTKFQSVTSMNYDSGWQTLVLFYNGHRIPNFPYHLCPVTTKILESAPLAGRIAGFNRQRPGTGIPLHTDGNNMWLTCQMGIRVPDDQQASITVGQETRHWEAGKCLLYDTTFQHETMNRHPTQERVVLHVDFFNTLALTPIEIEIMQYIYSLREQFMKAEGVAKVGAQLL